MSDSRKKVVYICEGRLYMEDILVCGPSSRIAKGSGMMPGGVSKGLERMRKQLRIYLTERGFEV